MPSSSPDYDGCVSTGSVTLATSVCDGQPTIDPVFIAASCHWRCATSYALTPVQNSGIITASPQEGTVTLSTRSRNTAKLSTSLSHNLNMYALAASAAGV